MGRELGDEAIYSMATSLHAWCLMLRSERDQARALVEEAWQIADRLDHLSAAFTAAWTAGSYLLFDDAQECHAILRRELDRPRQLQASNIRNVLLASDQDALLLMGDIERARAIREQVDTSVATVHPLPEIRFEFLAGDWDRARRLAEHRVAKHRGTGNTVVLTFALHMLGDVLHALGAIEESVAAYQEAAGFGKALLWWGDWSFVAQLRFAEVAATAGDVATARSLVSEGEAYLARGSGVRGLIGYVERARGVVAAVCGDVQHAGEAFAASAAAFERHVFPFEQAATFRAWGRALVAGGETRLALEKLDAAVNIYRKHGATSAWIDSARRDGSRLE
jgi:tetratricopeptide (TPR) repeat protein